MLNDPRGSVWRQWDLHIHTPMSKPQGYGGDTDEAWERFFADLEALPETVKAIGINDYLFIDGYERVLQAKEEGRLSNVELILPVVEMRLAYFAGLEGKWQRVNYHVIFSDEVKPSEIRTQFLNAISSEYTLNPNYEADIGEWYAAPTRESLIELGRRVYDAAPAEKKPAEGFEEIGFNSLNFDLKRIKECLRHHVFKGKHLTAVGKTEWSEMRWNPASIATKRTVINGANIVFTAAENVAAANRSIEKLRAQAVNSRLLDCSDAHHFSDSDQHLRIGQTLTWIKADPTFEGLKLALHRYDERVFLGEQPPKLAHVARNLTKYISSLRIRKVENSPLDEKWFEDVEVQFNHGLVSIIGNKGNGKSALTDIIALCGRTKAKELSFLSTNKFRDRENKANHFEATLVWESGTEVCRGLAEKVAEDEAEQLRYVPQTFFETITNETSVTEEGKFYGELQSVVFSHIPEDQQLAFESLPELLDHHAGTVADRLESDRTRLRQLNQQIAAIEVETSSEALRKLDAEIDAKNQEIQALQANPPTRVDPPSALSQALHGLEEIRVAIEAAEAGLAQISSKLGELRRQKSVANKMRQRIKLKSEEFERAYEEALSELTESGVPLPTAPLAMLQTNLEPLQEFADNCEQRILSMVREQDPLIEGTQAHTLERLRSQSALVREQLATADRAYQAYIEAQKQWEAQLEELRGSEAAVGSYHFLRLKRVRLRRERLPHLQRLKEERDELVLRIAGHLHGLVEVYESLAAPIKASISAHPLLKERYRLSFDVALVDTGFAERFLNLINQGRKGSFIGKQEGYERVLELLAKHDFGSAKGPVEFAQDVLDHLRRNYANNPPEDAELTAQLRQGVSASEIYDFIFGLEYLRPQYQLRLDGKGIEQLSPGERGVLLLIFYLLLDKSERPLVIDQPEENLDNESVYELLVPGVREAKTRRQLFIVTHNPNLAVVCDADQVVRATIHKEEANRVEYVTGALENPEFNMHVINVLEGTLPALRTRMGSYMQSLAS